MFKKKETITKLQLKFKDHINNPILSRKIKLIDKLINNQIYQITFCTINQLSLIILNLDKINIDHKI